MSKTIEDALEIAPNLEELLTTSKENLSQGDLSSLIDFAKIEDTAKSILGDYSEGLKDFIDQFSSQNIDDFFNNVDLTEEEKEKINTTFQRTIIYAAHAALNVVSKGFDKGDGILFSAIASESTINVLEGVLDYKNKIDKMFPGASDAIISNSLSVITGLVTVYSPPLGIALKAFGAAEKVSEFLKTENLDKTVNRLYEAVEKIEHDKQLSSVVTTDKDEPEKPKKRFTDGITKSERHAVKSEKTESYSKRIESENEAEKSNTKSR